jgi:transposase InsO family protein
MKAEREDKKKPPCFTENSDKTKEARVLFRSNIIVSLDLVINNKLTMDAFKKLFHISNTWAYELLQRRKAGESLERVRGHRKGIFNERQKDKIKSLYRSLRFANGDMPSMSTLRTCVNEEYEGFAYASKETYRNIVKYMPEYPEKKKNRTYRKRWEAPEVGYIVQGDTSTHAWIDGAKAFPLLLFIDDKSRRVLYARFIDSDNIENHRNAVYEMIKTYGKPVFIYYDNDPKYAKNGNIRLLLESIGINVINSRPYQPQGKGKIERQFGIFQKQLVPILKLKNADTIEKANEVLQWYVEKHNNDYNRSIHSSPEEVFKNSNDVFTDISYADLRQIELAFAIQETRRVSKTNEITIESKVFRLPPLNETPLAGRWVNVYFYTGKWIKVYYKDIFVTKYDWEEIYDS